MQLVFPKNYLTAFLAFGLLYFHGFRRCCVFMDFHVVVFSWISLLLYFHGVFRGFRYIFMDFDVAVFPWNLMLLYFNGFLCCNSMDFGVLFAHPLAGGQRKIICGANEFSWPPARGVGI